MNTIEKQRKGLIRPAILAKHNVCGSWMVFDPKTKIFTEYMTREGALGNFTEEEVSSGDLSGLAGMGPAVSFEKYCKMLDFSIVERVSEYDFSEWF